MSTVLQGKCFASPLYGHTNSLDTQHTEQLFQIYHQGLGTVTMEGREPKHIVLKKLSENSSSKNQWFDIFQHEFVMLIWLQKMGLPLVSTDSEAKVTVDLLCVFTAIY